MTVKNISVFGIFDNLNAERAIEMLRQQGFRAKDISRLAADNSGGRALAHLKRTKAPEGALSGVIWGSVIGGMSGFFWGSGTLIIPSLGSFYAAGPMVAALVGIGMGSMVGAFVGALAGLSIPEYEVKRFETEVHDYNVLLSVHCDQPGWIVRAKNIFIRAGGKDVASADEVKPNDPANNFFSVGAS